MKTKPKSMRMNDATLTQTLLLLLASTLSSSSSSSSSSPDLLRRIRRSLLRSPSSPRPLPPALLALCPRLLSSSPPLPRLTAALLGAASLLSLRHNRAIASDPALFKAFLRLLSPRTPENTLAALLAALLDLSASAFARDRLRALGAVHHLL